MEPIHSLHWPQENDILFVCDVGGGTTVRTRIAFPEPDDEAHVM